MLKKCFLILSFAFLSASTFGLTGGAITEVEDPGCYLYECDCYLYTEFSYGYTLTEGYGRDVVPFTMKLLCFGGGASLRRKQQPFECICKRLRGMQILE